VNNAPVANAGPDQTVTDSDGDGVETVTLDGRGSSDIDGAIVNYEWSEGGIALATGANPLVTLAVGTHTISLTVTDDAGATGSDTVEITVSPQRTELITNIVVANGKSYEKDTLVVAKLVYIDRTYTFTSVPPPYEGQEFIRTANNDKSATEPNFLSFTLTANATVYVAFDIRATNLPGWLDASWTETGDIIGTSDVSRRVYKKDLPAGTVTLGGNAVSPMSGAGSNYNVIAIGSGPPNQMPRATNDSATTAEDTAVDLNVLANDADPDGDALAVVSVTQGANGAVSINADSTVRYTPNADFTGTDSFSYTVSDGQGGTAPGTVEVTVTAVNDPPVAVNDTYSMQQDTTLAVAAASRVLANDRDVDQRGLDAQSRWVVELYAECWLYGDSELQLPGE